LTFIRGNQSPVTFQTGGSTAPQYKYARAQVKGFRRDGHHENVDDEHHLVFDMLDITSVIVYLARPPDFVRRIFETFEVWDGR